MGGLLVLVSLLIFVVSLISLIRPIRAIGITSRKRAGLLLAAGVVVFLLGGSLIEPSSDSGLPELSPPTVEPPSLRPAASSLPPPPPSAAIKPPATSPAPITAAPSPRSSAPPERTSQVDADSFDDDCGGGKFDFCKGKTVVWDGIVEKILDTTTVRARVANKLSIDVLFSKTIDPEVLDAGIHFRFAGIIGTRGWFDGRAIRKAELVETFNTKADLRAQREEKAQAEAAKKLALKNAAASKMNVSLEVYRLGDSKASDAWSACQTAVVDRATYGARRDWFPTFTWSIQENTITIIGRDVQIKNAFGAQRYAIYICKFNLDDGNVSVVSID